MLSSTEMIFWFVFPVILLYISIVAVNVDARERIYAILVFIIGPINILQSSYQKLSMFMPANNESVLKVLNQGGNGANEAQWQLFRCKGHFW